MQVCLLTVAVPFIRMAPKGHLSSHAPQAVHAVWSTWATYPDDATIGTPYFRMASIPPQQHLQQLQIA